MLFFSLFSICSRANLHAQCAGPTDQNVLGISDNGFSVSWTGGSMEAVRQEFVLSFCALEDPATESVGSLNSVGTPLNTSGFASGTTFFAYVRNICAAESGTGAEEASDWSTFTITTSGDIVPPDNDLLSGAYTFTLGAISADNFSGEEVIGTSDEPNEVMCGFDNSWWYTFTPTVTQAYKLSSGDLSATGVTTDTDVSLGVYSGSAHPLQEIVCQNTNNYSGGGETLDLMLTAGTTYYFRVAMGSDARPCNIRTTTEVIPIEWQGSASTDWFTAENWSTGKMPTAGQAISISGGAVRPCVIASDNALAGKITLEGGSLTVGQGAILTVSEGTSGVRVTGGGTLEVEGEVQFDLTSGIGISVREGEAHIRSTGLVSTSNGVVGLQVNDTVSIAGEFNCSNAEFDGIFVGESGGLELLENGLISVESPEEIGLLCRGNCWVNGSLIISKVGEAAIDTDGGLLTVGTTGSVEIDTAEEGIKNGSFSNYGSISVTRTEDDAISTGADCTNYGSITLLEGAESAIKITGTFTNEGTITIQDYSRDGVETSSDGVLQIGSAATLDINDVRRGLNGLLLVNDGTIGIVTTSSDAINTGGDCTNNGSITLSDVDSDGIDLEVGSTFTNAGTLRILDASSQALEDGIFNQTASGELFINGEVTSAMELAAGSALHPGSSPGCVESNTLSNLTGVELNVELEGTTACAEFDQLDLGDQAFDVTDGVLVLTGDYAPVVDDVFLIVRRSSTSNVQGTFDGLPEGATLRFNGAELMISYVAGDGDDIGLYVSSTLPLDLLFFTGINQGKSNVLTWATTNEENFSHFEIERSGNGHSWQLLDNMHVASFDGSELGENSYVYEEDAVTAFYRLKMIDLDGTYSYSDVVYVENDPGAAAGAMKVYPNPSNGRFSVDLTQAGYSAEGQGELSLLDMHGRQILSVMIAADVHHVAIDVPNARAGVYSLRLRNRAGQMLTRRVVLQ
ncbi:hypothetical protein A3850_005910 [Lewinella sp. 4G2]|nr:hypothetical protein A3850_005910 [Lewinella sp. 4G2]